jgi:hypothetical protein
MRSMQGRQVASIVWVFDGLSAIGGHPTVIVGSPRVIETPSGKVVAFDGAGDGLIVNHHPLAGAARFTVEVVFRPDAGGLKEQRFLHLQEDGNEDRILVETRLTGDGRWFLDTYVKSHETSQTLYAEAFPHSLGPWYHAALVFDGSEMRHYVNGAPELSAPIAFYPPGSGRTSIGVRLNRVSWFRGAIRLARFTPEALPPVAYLPEAQSH